MKNPYVASYLRQSWASGRAARRRGLPLPPLREKSPAFAAAFLRGWLGGPRGPFPAEYRNTWRRVW